MLIKAQKRKPLTSTSVQNQSAARLEQPDESTTSLQEVQIPQPIQAPIIQIDRAEIQKIVEIEKQAILQRFEAEIAEKRRAAEREIQRKFEEIEINLANIQKREHEIETILSTEKQNLEAEKAAELERIQAIEEQLQSQFNTAIQQGFEQGFQEAKTNLDKISNEFQEIIHTIHRSKEELLLEIEPQITSIALEVTRKILQRESKLDSNLILEQVKSAIRKVTIRGGLLEVSLNPDDTQHQAELESVLDKMLDKEVRLIFKEDPQVAQGSCIVDTQGGQLNANFKIQIESVKLAFEKYFGQEIILIEAPDDEETTPANNTEEIQPETEAETETELAEIEEELPEAKTETETELAEIEEELPEVETETELAEIEEELPEVETETELAEIEEELPEVETETELAEIEEELPEVETETELAEAEEELPEVETETELAEAEEELPEVETETSLENKMGVNSSDLDKFTEFEDTVLPIETIDEFSTGVTDTDTRKGSAETNFEDNLDNQFIFESARSTQDQHDSSEAFSDDALQLMNELDFAFNQKHISNNSTNEDIDLETLDTELESILNTELESASSAEPESVLNTELKSPSDTKLELISNTELESISGTELKPALNTEPELVSGTELESALDTELELTSNTDQESASSAEPESTLNTELESVSETELESVLNEKINDDKTELALEDSSLLEQETDDINLEDLQALFSTDDEESLDEDEEVNSDLDFILEQLKENTPSDLENHGSNESKVIERTDKLDRIMDKSDLSKIDLNFDLELPNEEDLETLEESMDALLTEVEGEDTDELEALLGASSIKFNFSDNKVEEDLPAIVIDGLDDDDELPEIVIDGSDDDDELPEIVIDELDDDNELITVIADEEEIDFSANPKKDPVFEEFDETYDDDYSEGNDPRFPDY
jgi:flagellar biosynthesis/type III secretory pathway protein FliH